MQFGSGSDVSQSYFEVCSSIMEIKVDIFNFVVSFLVISLNFFSYAFIVKNKEERSKIASGMFYSIFQKY